MQAFVGHLEENSAVEAERAQSGGNRRAISESLPFTLFWLFVFSA